LGEDLGEVNYFMDSITLFDLNEYLRRVVALNFPELIWVHCEVAQSSTSRGHLYLELIQKDSLTDEIIAQSSAVVWERSLRKLYQKHGRTVLDILSEGTEAHLQVRVSFHERYGLSLHIEEVDTAYTLGKLALQRRKTLENLAKDGLLDLQKKKNLAPVLQKIAVLSSETSAGWADFKTHLEQNNYGYHFDLELYPVSVQGNFAAAEMIKQLKQISPPQPSPKERENYDAVIIVRGGGSKTDLMAFDDAALCRAIAQMPLPVIVGIGHEIDETVLDAVAHLSLKTPTAVADFLIDHNARFESNILHHVQQIQYFSQQKSNYNTLLINDLGQKINYLSQAVLRQKAQTLASLEMQIRLHTQRILQEQKQALAFAERLIENSNPERILQRGFTITLQEGKIISSKYDLDLSKKITTRFKDGET
jgi:exodeoxyribonuclease VII large subunit